MATYYVNPDSAGGDGTTNALSGATAAYTSLSAWEAARQADLTGTGVHEVVCETGGTADTTTVNISGWTTTASDYIDIHTSAEHRHAGIWSDAKYRLAVADNNGFTISEDYVRISWLQVSSSATTATNRSAITISSIISAANEFRFYGNIIKGTGATSTYKLNGILSNDADAIVKAWNNIIYDCINGTTQSTGIYLASGTNCEVYNNTITDCGIGIWAGSSNVKAVNNLVNNIATASLTYVGTFSTGTDYNSTDSTDAIGVGSNNRTSQTFTFANEAGDDFHLAAGDAGAKDFGTSDPGAGLFSDDIDGVTRTGTWDIGADEYVAAGGSNLAWVLAGNKAALAGIGGLAG